MRNSLLLNLYIFKNIVFATLNEILIEAIENGIIDNVRAAPHVGANVNGVGVEGKPILMYVSFNNQHSEVVRILKRWPLQVEQALMI